MFRSDERAAAEGNAVYIRYSEISPYTSNLDESSGLSWKTSFQQGANIGRGTIMCQ